MQGVQRPGGRDRQQLEGGLGRTGLVLGVGAFQRPPRTSGGLVETARLLAAGTRPRRPRPPRARARSGRALQLFGGFFVSAEHRLRAVPGTTVRVDLRVGHLGQRAVGAAMVRRCGGLVDRGAHQRVAKPHPDVDLQQPGDLRGRRPPREQGPGARPRATAAPRRRSARTRRPAAAAASAAAGWPTGVGSSPRCGEGRSAHLAARTRRRAASAAALRGSSSSASGLPRASAMIRSRTPLVQRCAHRSTEQRTGVGLVEPLQP